MMNDSTGEIKAFLKRALELESAIHTCSSMIDYLGKLNAQVDDESHNVSEYKDGDIIPYEDLKIHPNAVYKTVDVWNYNRTQKRTVPTDTEYMRKSATFRRYHTVEDMEKGYAPPVDYEMERQKNETRGGRISRKIFEAIGTGIGAVVVGAIPAGIVAVIYAIFYGLAYGYRDVIPDMPFKAINTFIAIELAVLVVASVISGIKAFLKSDKVEPDEKGFNEEREFYLNKLRERNDKLLRDHRALAYSAAWAARLKKAREAAKAELEALYQNSPIFPKYHYFIAVAQLLEYFDSGRCTTLEGPDGAYNLYEDEISRKMIVSQLDNISNRSLDARNTQYYLCGELEKIARLSVGTASAFNNLRTGTYIGTSMLDTYLEGLESGRPAVAVDSTAAN